MATNKQVTLRAERAEIVANKARAVQHAQALSAQGNRIGANLTMYIARMYAAQLDEFDATHTVQEMYAINTNGGTR